MVVINQCTVFTGSCWGKLEQTIDLLQGQQVRWTGLHLRTSVSRAKLLLWDGLWKKKETMTVYMVEKTDPAQILSREGKGTHLLLSRWYTSDSLRCVLWGRGHCRSSFSRCANQTPWAKDPSPPTVTQSYCRWKLQTSVSLWSVRGKEGRALAGPREMKPRIKRKKKHNFWSYI